MSDTEKTILKAAREIFLRKGFDGATMQDIANEAKINRALLHYYFRSKEKLFETIFVEALYKITKIIDEFISSETDIFKKIEILTEKYIDTFINDPYLPLFVIHELARDPNKILQIMQSNQIHNKIPNISNAITAAILEKQIRPIRPQQLIVNIISLCIFPFAGKPIIKGILFNNDETAYHNFLIERKTEVSKFIINSIKIQ